MLINKLVIIGVGLIGGSLARALKQAGECTRVSGYGRNRQNLEAALALGVIDEIANDIGTAVRGADMVVLATPLLSFRKIFAEVAANIGDDAVITDVGSTKGSVVDDARSILAKDIGRFVPAHPIAGTEKSGVDASFADLFRDHTVIITPLPENPVGNLQRVTSMWETCGANVVNMPVARHDMVLGATSHLPHVLAYALVSCLANMDDQSDIFSYSAGGFRDFTRIASSSPEMWSDICISNRENLLKLMDKFGDELTSIAGLIRDSDRDGLLKVFTEVKTTRDSVIKKLPSPGNDME